MIKYYLLNNSILYKIDTEIDNLTEFQLLYPNAEELTQEQYDNAIEHNLSNRDLIINMWKPTELPPPTIEEIKTSMINQYSNLSFIKRQELLPDYKLINGALGVYGEEKKQLYIEIVNAFRNEYYRLKNLVDQSETKEELDGITTNFESIINQYKNQV